MPSARALHRARRLAGSGSVYWRCDAIVRVFLWDSNRRLSVALVWMLPTVIRCQCCAFIQVPITTGICNNQLSEPCGGEAIKYGVSLKPHIRMAWCSKASLSMHPLLRLEHSALH